MATHIFQKTSKPQRRREWNDSTNAFVQKMKETGRGPFRGGKSKKNSRSNTILRLGQRSKAVIKAAAASKRAGMKRQNADFSKAQQRAEKTYYDDATVTAAPFMKRYKKDARVSSNSMTMIPQWDALGPTLTKKVLPSLARSSTTPPAPSPGPLK